MLQAWGLTNSNHKMETIPPPGPLAGWRLLLLGTEDRGDILKDYGSVPSALLKATHLVPWPADLGLSGPCHRGMWYGQLLPGLALGSAPVPGGRGTGARLGDPCFKLSPLPIKRGPVPSTGREGPVWNFPPKAPGIQLWERG